MAQRDREPVDVDLAALSVVTDRLLQTLAAVEDDRWGLPTPCADWDLGALVDHIIGGNWFTTRVLAGHSKQESMTYAVNRFSDDSDRLAQAAQSLRDQQESFSRPGVLDQSWDHVSGPLHGRQMLRLRTHDLIVHAWDVEQATKPPAVLPEELVQWGLEELSDSDSVTAEHFGLVVQVASSDQTSATYLRIFGR